MCNIPARTAVKFVKSLIGRFGVPSRITTSSGTQFMSNLFKSYCSNLGAQVNSAQVANAEVLKGLKTGKISRLKLLGKNWIEELPSVLWSIRTTATKPTGETPFSLVYGAEAVLPNELTHGSP